MSEDDLTPEDIGVVLNGSGINYFPRVESVEEIAERVDRIDESRVERWHFVGTLDEYVDDVVDYMEGIDGDPDGLMAGDSPYTYPHDE